MLKQINEINETIQSLLLLADPSVEMINQYIKQALLYELEVENKTIGVLY